MAPLEEKQKGLQVRRPCDGREQVSGGLGGSVWLGSGTPGTSKGDHAGERQGHNDTGRGGRGEGWGSVLRQREAIGGF